MKITIKDVAKRANVSKATVSRVLNQSKPVSLQVREKVMKAVEELGFNPNPVARSLAMNKSGLIGVLISDISNMFFSVLVSGIEAECFKQKYTPLLCSTKGDTERELYYLNLLKDQYVDGIIIFTPSPKEEHLHFFEKNLIPVLFKSYPNPAKSEFSCINIDNFKAFYDITQFLIDLGHEKIGMFGGRFTTVHSEIYQRYAGFRKALEDNGLEFHEKWFLEGETDIPTGYMRGKKLFSMKDIPTAVCCASDTIAIGAIRAAKEIGLRVPEDISITGFDDIPIAEAYSPSLTTVRQPIIEMGIQSVQMLIQQIQDKDNRSKEIRILSHEIIVRESCLKVK
ncbi:LacI family DNA-binding transcriptional regulator [Bacillus sp. ISL-46]|uniref:LacI family DNA-binding transcriptional regulator n=1 Tax=Bacillus sp. ISL-46 TaxID=2819129 RepID=UPI001BEBC9CF|nr:LacI family DNA-binding transcriptional regulator [Bacillus sp. ISL-46]MBT2722137.1 LacI family DNA-binding transcriptional regulator [Bacillus sp. ISL-46]